MIKSLWAKLTGGRVVYIKNIDGSFYVKIAYKSPFGEWVTTDRLKLNHLILRDGGKVDGSHFTTLWKFKE